MRQASFFKKTELTRAAKAHRAAGFELARVEIDKKRGKTCS